MNGPIFQDFPVFGCDWGRRTFGQDKTPISVVLLAGGGGATKSGIKNQILLGTPSADAQGKPTIDTLSVFETDDLVASFVAFSSDARFVCASVDQYDERKDGDKVVRTPRGSCMLLAVDEDKTLRRLAFFQTDWDDEDSTMFVCRFNGNASELATAGADGVLRLWTLARTGTKTQGGMEATKHIECKKHGDAVMDLSWSPDSAMIATASKDGTARVWRAKDGNQLLELPAMSGLTGKGSKAIGKDCYRAIRLLRGDNGDAGEDSVGKGSKLRLLATQSPQRGSSFVVECELAGGADADALKCTPLRTVLLCDHSASPRSLCVSGSGKHVGVGTNGGWIFVLGADGLGRVVGREVTGLPVTMVAFSPEVEAESSACDVVMGVSPDRTCYILSATGGSSALMRVLVLFVVVALLWWNFTQQQ